MSYEYTTEDIEYIRHDKPFKLRLYKPRGAGPFPAVVDLHGGAWGKGSLEECKGRDEVLARSGLLVAALDFRDGNHGYPTALVDINYAIRWLKARAQQLQTRADLIGISGQSSGGHLAMLVAMRPDDPRYAAIPLSSAPRLDATVACLATRSPISDTVARFAQAETMKREAMIENNRIYFNPWDSIHDGNPQAILERRETPTLVPMLIMQGALDDNVLPAVQEKFAATYRAAGGVCGLTVFEGCEHEWVAHPGPQTTRAQEMAAAFFARHLKA